GIELSTTESDALGHPAAMLVSVSGGVQLMAVAAVAPEGSPARLIRIGGFHIDVAPRDSLVILTNNDVPGVIGRVGTLLGDRGVNIAEYHQARLSLGGMDRVLELDPIARTVRVEPGVFVGELKRACAAHGLLLAPDPTSEEECTVGGAVACNASGARSLRYGATRPHVRALRVAMA